jgi:putative salt-induced outer membrane protein YdiY
VDGVHRAGTRPSRPITLLALTAVVVGALSCPSSAGAQSETEAGQPPEEADAIDAGAPEQAAEPVGTVSRVESALRQTQQKVKQGITDDYRIEFGDTNDWIELKTGEWLRGDFHWLRPKGLESGADVDFYSNQLDDLTFSWSDIVGVHSPKTKSYTFKGKITVAGKAMITKDQVIIQTENGVKTHLRSALLAISEGPTRERTWWSTRLSVGFSANAGNTNQGSLTSQWDLTRTDGHTLAGLHYQGTVGYADNQLNVNRHLGNVGTALFLWDRFYLIPIAGQLLYDAFQNIKLRATPAAGVGMHLFNKTRERRHHTNKFEWDLQSGLGYQFLSFFSIAAGASNPQNDGFILFRTHWKLEFLNDNIELTVDWRTNLVYTTFGSTNHTGTADFSVEITDRFDFLTSFLFLRTRDPEPRSDGTVPKQNDYQIAFSIALKIN